MDYLNLLVNLFFFIIEHHPVHYSYYPFRLELIIEIDNYNTLILEPTYKTFFFIFSFFYFLFIYL